MPDLFGSGMFSNNAPPPIPGGFGNPTGINSGAVRSGAGTVNTGFPSFPQFGPIAQTSATFGPNQSPFSNDAGGMNTLKSNLPGFGGDNIGQELVHAYGEGGGNAILQILKQGLFNPKVANALIASLQPGVARGQADILNAFGEGGSRYSSSAAIGLGDYNSQVQLNEGQIMAGLYQNAQNQELSLLQSVLPTLHDEKANSGWFNKLVGGLESVTGIVGSLFGGGSSDSSSGSNSSSLSSMLQSLLGGSSSSTDLGSVAAAPSGSMDNTIQQLINAQQQNSLAASAGNIWGGGNEDQYSTAFPY